MMPFVLILVATSMGEIPVPTPVPVAAPVPVVESQRRMVLVVGAAGTSEFGRQFSQWADRWERAAQTGGVRLESVGRASVSHQSDRDRLRQLLNEAQRASYEELWLVLIGHGTFDGREAKFNLRGPDVSAAELQQWLEPLSCPTIVINCASSSGPFSSRLSKEDRVIVTATKSGFEQNFARFGDFLSQSIADPDADLDKDGQISLLEAWLKASRQTQEFYRVQGRLPTEHSLLDDNGDGLATRADWFRGVRPVHKPTGGASVDGLRAHQFHLVRSPDERQMPPHLRRKRDQLELAVIRLRDRKAELPKDAYYQQLEALLVPLAELYQQAESLRNSP